ncbi:hypothetical protein A9Q98_05500 [Thalassotalea sp. 42_200_T64]|nr:hypothetical protein A9Q98_05500 [Thalassotalea sp. 42_200_T64]
MFKYLIILFLFLFSATISAENSLVQSSESVAIDSSIALAEDEINFDQAAELAKQQRLKTQVEFCAPCHGKNGLSSLPIYPNLAGQHQQYLLKQLLAYKYRRRKDAVMSPMVSRLNEDELVELAHYYASLSSDISQVEINGEFNESSEASENTNEN